MKSVGAGTDGEKEDWTLSKDAECDIRLQQSGSNNIAGPTSYSCGNRGYDADCHINDWGCNNK
jgi:hypothetical protein